MSEEFGRLAPLKELGQYRVAAGYPDIRGWSVYGVDGEKMGTVRDLIVDEKARKVRFLLVGLKHALFEKERHVVVPIGRANLDATRDIVLLAETGVHTADRLRDYDRASFDRERRDYTQPEFDDSRFWSRKGRPATTTAESLQPPQRPSAGPPPVVTPTPPQPAVTPTPPQPAATPTPPQPVATPPRPQPVASIPAPGAKAKGGDVQGDVDDIHAQPARGQAAADSGGGDVIEEIVLRRRRVEPGEAPVDSGVKKKEPV